MLEKLTPQLVTERLGVPPDELEKLAWENEVQHLPLDKQQW